MQRNIIFIAILSLVFGIAAFLEIPYQFYLWELFIDVRILFLIAYLIFLSARKEINLFPQTLPQFSFYWKQNVAFFFSLVPIYAIITVVGLLFGKVSIAKMDNAMTLILATAFDIPAAFVFSLTSVFIEEYFFRGFILTSFLLKYSNVRASVFSSLLWVIFCLSEIIPTDKIHWLSLLSNTLYFFSMGIICSALFSRYKTIWPGYSLRIAVISLTPIILSSQLVEADAFFRSDSSLFMADGFLTSAAFLLTAGYFLKKTTIVNSSVEE